MTKIFQGEILIDAVNGVKLSNGYEVDYLVCNLSNTICKMKKFYNINIYGEKGCGVYNGKYIYKLGDDSREKVLALLNDKSLNPTHFKILYDLTHKDCIYAKYSNPYGCKNVLSVIRRIEKKNNLKFKRELKESNTTNKKYMIVYLDRNCENVLKAKELLKNFKIDSIFTLNSYKKCA